MKRKLIISAFILTFCLTSCSQTNTENINLEKLTSTLQVDTSVIAVLTLDTNLHWIFKPGKPTGLTSENLLKIETVLKKCIDEYNPEQESKFKEINDKHPEYRLDKKNFIIDLRHYKRQYMVTINSKGEKEVWINCFCNTLDKNWKKSLIFVHDGGNCYFNLKVNLTTGQYYELMVNGNA